MDSLPQRLKHFGLQEFASALTAPPEIYSSNEIHALERDKIFAKEWICVGRTQEIPETGDYLTSQLEEHSIIVIRQKDGTVKALSNVCLHRCAQLLTGNGNIKSIVCPYHAWVYQLDGRLSNTIHMERTPNFEETSRALPEVKSEVWQGFIYITLNADAAPVKSLLSEFEEVVRDYQLEHYVHAFTYEEVWPANWKCFVENYLDAYHIFKVHKKTFGAYGNFESDTELFEGGEQFTYHLIVGDDEASYRADPADSIVHPMNTSLQGKWRATTVLAAVFPSQTMQIQPDLLWYVTVLPEGVDHFKMRWSVSIPPEIMQDNKASDYVEAARSLLCEVNAEDEAIIQRVYEGSKDPMAARSPYSWLESNVFQFGRYLARMLS
ncbi:MAG: aromatic ring-hydroxylating dioxygenase subunit alpha [Pseudomonadales bacterium]